MSVLVDDTTGITVSPVGADGVFQWSATMGDGTRRGFADSAEEGMERAKRAKRYLLMVESHNPDAVEQHAMNASGTPGTIELVSSWGGRVHVNEADVEQALANGCRLLGDEEEPQHAAAESLPEKARRRQRSKPEPDSELD